MRRIGILGGTFDPVHNGHIGLAEDAKQQEELEKVIFMPAKLQPFKLHKEVTEGKHRLEMIRLAVSPYAGLEASDYELRQERISYTYKTLREIQKQEGNETQLYFITGTDAFLKIAAWRNAEEMLRTYSFAVGSRPGYKDGKLDTCIDRIKKVYNTHIVKIENQKRDISATEIRERLEKGSPLKGLIPESVERYIKENGLY